MTNILYPRIRELISLIFFLFKGETQLTKYSSLSERYFINGIKRTCINYPDFSKFELMQERYPYINKNDFESLGDNYLFFQTEELKKEMYHKYIKGNEHVALESPEHHWIIGNILEYPPKAIEFFIKGGIDKSPDRAIGMQYCGNYITADIFDLEDNAKWLWRKFPYPLDDILLIRKGIEFTMIEFQDYEEIRKIIKSVQQKINTAT